MLKHRFRDNVIQLWHAKLYESNTLFFYRMFETEFKFENYLLITTNKCLHNQYQDLGYPLIIWKSKRGEIMVIIREEKLCKLCNSKAVESE